MRQILSIAAMCAAILSGQVTINATPSREFGYPTLTTTLAATPNLVEGRELNAPASIAFDYTQTPPGVYIADPNNNRVLGWKNANNIGQGTGADIVIGQPDFFSTSPLGP